MRGRRGVGDTGAMDIEVARELAYERHAGQRDRLGRPIFEHLERVVARVPPRVEALAWVHDLLERTTTDVDELRACGLRATEEAALTLLTRKPEMTFELYLLQIAHARGLAGEFARVVKIADLEDHVDDQSHGHFVLGAPPYRWGLHHLRGRPVHPGPPTTTGSRRPPARAPDLAAPAAEPQRIVMRRRLRSAAPKRASCRPAPIVARERTS